MAAKNNRLNSNCVSVARHPAGALVRFFVILFLIPLAVTAFIFLIPAHAKADSPHGPFSSSTDRCGRCHRMHDAKADKLLSETDSILFCTSCHAKGSGADTAVMEGALIRPTAPGGDVFVAQGTLLGGGFDKVGNTAAATSSHRLGEAGTPFGSDANATVVLTCLSCHTPHQSPNYRLLRRQPTGGGADLSVTWNGPYRASDGSDDFAFEERVYGSGLIVDAVNRTVTGTSVEVTRNYKAGLSTWCSSCHTRYMTPADTTAYNAGDVEGAKVRYRHEVNVPIVNTFNQYNPSARYDFYSDLPLQDLAGDGRSSDDTILCLTCHRAHGTAALMRNETVLTSADDRGTLPTGSMLLRLDDRQVCQIACHKVI